MGCTSHENEFNSGVGRISFEIDIVDPSGLSAEMPISLTLTALDGGQSYTWNDIKEFSPRENFHVGKYIAKAFIGSADVDDMESPYFEGVTEFTISEGELNVVRISCCLTQAIFTYHIDNAASSDYSVNGLAVHPYGYGYKDLNRDVVYYLKSGVNQFNATVSNSQGESVTVMSYFTIDAIATEKYDVGISIEEGNVLTIRCADNVTRYVILPELFTTAPPAISTRGFVDDVGVNLTEGFPSDYDISMAIEAGAGIKNITLTTYSDLRAGDDFYGEYDLLDPQSKIYEYGLKFDMIAPEQALVDFKGLLESINTSVNTTVYLILQCEDQLCRVSDPMILKVHITSVEISVNEIEEALIGIDKSAVSLNINVPKVDPSDFNLYVNDDGNETPLIITDSYLDADKKELKLCFNVPQGLRSVPVSISYMGTHKLDFEVKRRVPDYRLMVDAFATSVRINIIADSDDEISAITKYARVKVENSDIAVLSRDPDSGLIICTGFTPSKEYKISTVVLDDGFAPEAIFTTEDAQLIPDGDFEDAAACYKYSDLPSGGIYSSTSFPIFNKQNFVDIDVWWPKKYWTSINAKTFCRQPSNRNTWYMQLSSVVDFSTSASGNKSIRVSSVGWSLTGGEIEPYVQKGSSYQPYSGNRPPIDHISAGYLFLGTYSFDPSTLSEVYTEGISFNSRPSSLNGFYKYMPDVNNIDDRGWVKIELINKSPEGNDTVIASGRMEFSNASFFRSFNIPLVYNVYNVKATGVKVTFCSSVYSESISLDDPSVPVSADLPEACFKGSSLWIDDLSFSY